MRSAAHLPSATGSWLAITPHWKRVPIRHWVATWSREVQREQEALTAKLPTSGHDAVRNRRMTSQEIKELVDTLGGLLNVLQTADPADKLEVYRQLGVKLTYNHERRVVTAESRPEPPVRVVNVSEGDLNPHALAGTSTSS